MSARCGLCYWLRSIRLNYTSRKELLISIMWQSTHNVRHGLAYPMLGILSSKLWHNVTSASFDMINGKLMDLIMHTLQFKLTDVRRREKRSPYPTHNIQ